MTSRPVPVRVANFASVSKHSTVSRRIFFNALTAEGRFGVPQLVFGCEAADFDATLEVTDHRRLAAAGWDALQFGRTTRDPARMGSLLAWRDARPIGKPDLLLGSPAGDGVRDRWGVRQKFKVNGHRLPPCTAGHAPPDRSERPQEQFLDEVRSWPGLVGADFNERPRELEARYDRQVAGIEGEVLALLIPRGIPFEVAPARIGSDHLAIDVLLYPDRKKEHHR